MKLIRPIINNPKAAPSESQNEASKLLTKEQLIALPTHRLLAYKNSILKYPEDYSKVKPGDDMNKEHPDWIRCYADLKEILATREHLE